MADGSAEILCKSLWSKIALLFMVETGQGRGPLEAPYIPKKSK